jgi:uncharacterized protein (DUF433 family)
VDGEVSVEAGRDRWGRANTGLMGYNAHMDATIARHIDTSPDVCGGKPRIAGTRIRVEDIYVWFELQRKSAEEIVSDFPQLSMGDVFAAMAYYWDHRDEIQRQMSSAEDRVADLKVRTGPGPLAKKLGRDDRP